MTFDDLRSFAFGELGWSLERYRCSTVDEFNKASAGYWRNWERNTGWLMRELVFTEIAGNPYIKQEDKPKKSQIIKLSIDVEDKPITAKEAKKIEKQFLKK